MTTSDDSGDLVSDPSASAEAAEPPLIAVWRSDRAATDRSGPAEVSAPAAVEEPDTAVEEQAPAGDRVGELFRDVDTQSSELAQRARDYRDQLTRDVAAHEPVTADPIAASAERFRMVEQLATLQADVERQAAELDERDRMLGELSERLLDFETRHRAAGKAADEAEALRQQLLDERRSRARVEALLDASLAERDELSLVAQRLQHDNDDLESRLESAAARFDEVEQTRSSLADGVARLEAAREAEAAEHAVRLEELQTARVELRRLNELLDEAAHARDDAVKRSDRIEHDIERRANEINYLNRRIEGLTERAAESDDLEAQVRALTEEQALLNRKVGDLERDLEAKTAEAAASARAVEALAERSSQNDALVMRVRELEAARASQVRAAPPLQASELHDLASRARALGEERSSSDHRGPSPSDFVTDRSDRVTSPDLSHLPPPPPRPADTSRDHEALSPPVGAAPIEPPTIGIAEAGIAEAGYGAAGKQAADRAAVTGIGVGSSGAGRRRLVLPAHMRPDTPEAVEYLLSQQRLTAIVDARSVCARAGIRPRELFDRLARLRDRFDLPIEVVTTPVSTPIGGAPSLPAIGVHSVTGADTVSDRVRALCIGFADDEQLVVIADDDHVRRAAIGKEANIVDPTVALGLA